MEHTSQRVIREHTDPLDPSAHRMATNSICHQAFYRIALRASTMGTPTAHRNSFTNSAIQKSLKVRLLKRRRRCSCSREASPAALRQQKSLEAYEAKHSTHMEASDRFVFSS